MENRTYTLDEVLKYGEHCREKGRQTGMLQAQTLYDMASMGYGVVLCDEDDDEDFDPVH